MALPTAPSILPTDATQTKAWQALTEHYANLKDTKATLKKWFTARQESYVRARPVPY